MSFSACAFRSSAVTSRTALSRVVAATFDAGGVVVLGFTASHVASNPPPASKPFHVDFVMALRTILTPPGRPANLC